jgi:3-hydroxypropanoate dehydrogenase
MGPTGGNSHPMRVLFVKTAEAKAKLLPGVAPMNVEKARTAPVTAILAYDTAFYENMPRLFPARPEMREVFAGMPAEMRDGIGQLNATLAAGYFIIAARALGLDAGPMGGFERNVVDAAFFADSTWRSFLLVNLGHGDTTKLYPRNPRLAFDEACRIA